MEPLGKHSWFSSLDDKKEVQSGRHRKGVAIVPADSAHLMALPGNRVAKQDSKASPF